MKAGDEQRGSEREPRLDRWELQREHREADAKALITPASKADVSKLSQTISSLANSVNLLKRRRSESVAPEQGYSQQPRYYVRNSGGQITRGPY